MTHFPFSFSSLADEPHATRRQLILEKYPQIKKLMVVDRRFKWIVIALILIQFASFYCIRNVSSFWFLFLLAYCFGGVLNHALTLAIHEVSHNQAFGHSKPLHNKLFGIVANLPLGFPMSITFKKYHLEHHRYQGDDILDTDIPSLFETRVFTTTFRKIFWVILQPFFYGFRPLFVYPKPPGLWEFINLVCQLLFDFIVGSTLGWHVVGYMVGASLISMGLHPVAGHFISEHYIMFEANKRSVLKKAQELKQVEQVDEEDLSKCEFTNGVYTSNGKLLIPETCSYYGPLNWVTFNVGYHVEHHDFPSIPGTQLPKVRQIAPEYYDSLHSHSSWVKVLYQYIVDPTVGPFARVKRPHKPKFSGKTNGEQK